MRIDGGFFAACAANHLPCSFGKQGRRFGSICKGPNRPTRGASLSRPKVALKLAIATRRAEIFESQPEHDLGTLKPYPLAGIFNA